MLLVTEVVQAGMALATLTGSVMPHTVSAVAVVGCSPSTATTIGLATATMVVE